MRKKKRKKLREISDFTAFCVSFALTFLGCYCWLTTTFNHTLTIAVSIVGMIVLMLGYTKKGQESATFDFTRSFLVFNVAYLFMQRGNNLLEMSYLIALSVPMSVLALYRCYQIWRNWVNVNYNKFLRALDALLMTILVIIGIMCMMTFTPSWFSALAIVNFGVIMYMSTLAYIPKTSSFTIA